MKKIGASLFVVAVAAIAACRDVSGIARPIDPVASEAATPSIARGAALAAQLCATCHGTSYAGGTAGSVQCPSLQVVREYNEASFSRLLLQRVDADGRAVDAEMSPSVVPDEEDRRALYLYLRTLIEPQARGR